ACWPGMKFTFTATAGGLELGQQSLSLSFESGCCAEAGVRAARIRMLPITMNSREERGWDIGGLQMLVRVVIAANGVERYRGATRAAGEGGLVRKRPREDGSACPKSHPAKKKIHLAEGRGGNYPASLTVASSSSSGAIRLSSKSSVRSVAPCCSTTKR